MRLALAFSAAVALGVFGFASHAGAQSESGFNEFEAASNYDANHVAPGTAAANAAEEFEDDSEFSNWIEENGGVVSTPAESETGSSGNEVEASEGWEGNSASGSTPTDSTSTSSDWTGTQGENVSQAEMGEVENAGDGEMGEVADTATPVTPMNHAVKLGQVGYDDSGRPGRVHVVIDGDTLWDISDAYLGTPWVWPSIWTDNQGIDNPHLINPGDHIWITPDEMRRITPEEAEQFLAGQPSYESFDEEVPAAFDETAQSAAPIDRGTYTFSANHTQGFVSAEEYNGTATIVDATTEKVWLAQPDRVLIGWGQGETEVGDQYQIFRAGRRLVNTDNYEVLGYTTEMLGWLEVEEVHDETATAKIRLSRSEVRRGDHLMPRPKPQTEIPVQAKPNVDGTIIHMPDHRSSGGDGDVVYLDRGASDGLLAGSPLEIYRPMDAVYDELRKSDRALPDDVVAKLIVVDARESTAVAVITHASTEIQTGDTFRGSDSLR